MKQADKKALRVQRLMPNGVPRYIRIYDNGGKTADRYTVCYTGRYRRFNQALRQWDWWQYVGMSENPFFPLGICQHGESAERIDQPSYKHLGKRIKFADLPRDCRRVVVGNYCEIWGLKVSPIKWKTEFVQSVGNWTGERLFLFLDGDWCMQPVNFGNASAVFVQSSVEKYFSSLLDAPFNSAIFEMEAANWRKYGVPATF